MSDTSKKHSIVQRQVFQINSKIIFAQIDGCVYVCKVDPFWQLILVNRLNNLRFYFDGAQSRSISAKRKFLTKKIARNLRATGRTQRLHYGGYRKWS